jgi:hypothetical protein
MLQQTSPVSNSPFRKGIVNATPTPKSTASPKTANINTKNTPLNSQTPPLKLTHKSPKTTDSAPQSASSSTDNFINIPTSLSTASHHSAVSNSPPHNAVPIRNSNHTTANANSSPTTSPKSTPNNNNNKDANNTRVVNNNTTNAPATITSDI